MHGSATEQWRDGNDNLTFDNEGNLYVLQGGGRNHIWMVRPCHTATNPQVELFAVIPAGAEPTGMTFSPDYRFMFLSIQHPSSANATIMTDAAGSPKVFNRESAIVIARKEYLGANATLPITFAEFNASKTNNSKVLLEWKYFTDESVARFEVQRMVSGGSFETIRSIAKTVNVAQQQKHSFTDEAPYDGKNFYRIKALQQDGRELFTDIKTVDINASNKLQLVNTYPNPANASFHIALVSPAAHIADIKVFNTSGVQVLQRRNILKAGSNNIALDIKELPSGVYFVVINAGSETIRTRLVKRQ